MSNFTHKRPIFPPFCVVAEPSSQNASVSCMNFMYANYNYWANFPYLVVLSPIMGYFIAVTSLFLFSLAPVLTSPPSPTKFVQEWFGYKC